MCLSVGNVALQEMTCQETLNLYGSLVGIPARRLPGCVSGLLEAVGLKGEGSKRAGRLSGGMKRKLCLAIALIGDSPVIFLDEPSAGKCYSLKNVLSFSQISIT